MRFTHYTRCVIALCSVSLCMPAILTAQDSTVNVDQDFTPGTRVIWSTDFANAPVGDFPRTLELKQGNFETASWNNARWLRTTSGGVVVVPLPEVLPAQFTLEFDYAGGTGWSMNVHFKDVDVDGDIGQVDFSTSGDAGIEGGTGGANASSNVGDFSGQVIHCQVMVDHDYVKTYINGKRTAQVPKATSAGATRFSSRSLPTPIFRPTSRTSESPPAEKHCTMRSRVKDDSQLVEFFSIRARMTSNPSQRRC